MKPLRIKNIVIGEGIPKICVPIMGCDEQVLTNEIQALQNESADIVEWRIDYFNDVMDLDACISVLAKLRVLLKDIVLLATFRSKQEGGEKEISNQYYVELNKKIIDTKHVDLIDIELFTGEDEVKELLDAAHQVGVKVIMSSHDFYKTPPYDEIITRMKTMQDYGADILKMAVMPTCKGDVLTLLKATNDMYERYADRPIITMSMNLEGVLSRICGETFGSSMTFGAAKEASAPGQMAVKDLRIVLDLLHKSLL